MSFENAESVAQELKMFTENDGDIYRQSTTPILKNLVTKRAQGKYDHELAAQTFMYLAEAGARKYAREFDRDESRWHAIFPVEVRRQVAAEWRDEFEVEAKLGNYDHLLPKKYQKKPTAKTKAAKKKDERSLAAQAGYHDGTEWANETNPSRSEVNDLLRPGHVYPDESLINALESTKLAKVLGISVRDVKNRTNAFHDACGSYNQNFQLAATRFLDAIESN